MNRIKMREYKRWLQQALQKEELTSQEMEQILDGQLHLPARAMDAALIRRCRLALYPNLQGPAVPGKQETLERVHAFLQKEGMKESAGATETASAKRRFFLRPATLTACILFCVLLFGVSFDAVGFNVWDLLFSWNDDTMKMEINMNAKLGNDTVDYLGKALSDAFFQKLVELKITPLLPSWMPEGFELKDTESRIESSYLSRALGVYACGDKEFKISVIKNTQTNSGGIWSLEKDEREPDIFEEGGIEFYIMDNLERSRAFWLDPPYTISISGNLTREELRRMVDSMFERSTSK